MSERDRHRRRERARKRKKEKRGKQGEKELGHSPWSATCLQKRQDALTGDRVVAALPAHMDRTAFRGEFARHIWKKEFKTPMAQGRSTKIITMIKWIRTIRLSIKNSLSLSLGMTA